MDSPHFCRVTLKDIAARLSLSHATVSMALRDHPDIAGKTKRRVKEEAKRSGYRPEPMLSALASYRRMRRPPEYHGSLAWLYNHECLEKLLRLRLFRSYYEGACARAKDLGFHVDAYSFQETPPERLSKILQARGVQGLLIAPLSQPNTRLDMQWDRFSAIAFGFSLTRPVLHVVCSAQYRIALQASRKLQNLGYRRIGFFTTRDVDERTDQNFTGGLHSASLAMPASCRVPPLLIDVDVPPKNIPEAIRSWISKWNVDAVICGSGMHPYVAEAGYRIPEDVAVALIGHMKNSPDFSGMDENGLLIGTSAVNSLVAMINRGERGVPGVPSELLIEGTWVSGGSTPCVKMARAGGGRKSEPCKP